MVHVTHSRLAHLHLLPHLSASFLLQLPLTRLEDGLCNCKVSHFPLLHQLLYHCLHHHICAVLACMHCTTNYFSLAAGEHIVRGQLLY
jgi:hypothetical protein